LRGYHSNLKENASISSIKDYYDKWSDKEISGFYGLSV
jgi:hypothetical protein